MVTAIIIIIIIKTCVRSSSGSLAHNPSWLQQPAIKPPPPLHTCSFFKRPQPSTVGNTLRFDPTSVHDCLNHFNNISTTLHQGFKQTFVPVTGHRPGFSSDSQDNLDVCIFPTSPNIRINPVIINNQATTWLHALQTTPSTFNHNADNVSTPDSTQCALCSQAKG